MNEQIVNKVKETVITAGSTLRQDKIDAYKRAIETETSERAKWALEMILENIITAKESRGPLCDDTGIPHLFLEIGGKRTVSAELLDDIYAGIELGLEELPGRPMAIKGNDIQRIEQSEGLNYASSAVLPAPLLVKRVEEDVLRLHIIMQGGGPAIRAKTYRVFHKHNIDTVRDEIVEWATEAVAQLGCSPCTLAIGIGRSHYEAAALMMEAQVYGNYNKQSELEEEITKRVNQSGTGAMGLKGDISVLGTFVKIGPQRASGVRIVSLRPCCCFEPRIGSVEL
ncbi:MAG: fumarate hydratase [Lachnospiraceae bacterium]